MQMACKVRNESLTHETKNYQRANEFVLCWPFPAEYGACLRNSLYFRKTTFEKSTFSLLSGYQLQIAFDLGMVLVSTSPLRVTPSGAHACSSCRKLIAEFTPQKHVNNLIIHCCINKNIKL